MQFSARTRISQNKHAVNGPFYLLNTRTICVIFLYNWTQCIDGLSLLLLRYVRKGNDAKNPEFSAFENREFLIIQKTIYGELRKSSVSKFYYNSVGRRDLMSFRSGQTMKTI